MVGSSGAIHNLVQVAVNKAGDSGRTIFQQDVEASVLQEVTQDLISSTRADRLRMKGIDQKRVDQIVAAAALVHMLLEELPIRRVQASPNALREGMVVHFIRQNHERLEQLSPFGDVRRRSINELGFRCQWEVRHAQKVSALALQLFDICIPLHGFGPDERELLEYASLLHDVGYHISRSNHHKHSHYIIANADLNGFQPEEIETMALIARYHAGACPRSSHASLKKLGPEYHDFVFGMAALLRIGEGLDRSHFQNVRSLQGRLTDEKLELSIETDSDPELDLWGRDEEWNCSSWFTASRLRSMSWAANERIASDACARI